MYRHALPPGFVLKKDKKKEEKEVHCNPETCLSLPSEASLFEELCLTVKCITWYTAVRIY